MHRPPTTPTCPPSPTAVARCAKLAKPALTKLPLTQRVLAKLALILLAPLLLTACGFQQHREHLALLHANGKFTEALAELDDPETQSLYDSQDQLLLDLDRGALSFYLGLDRQAFEYFESAERFMDLTATQQSTGDTAVQWLLNDTFATYAGEPYEDVYVNVFKLLGHLRAGRIEGGASVEARRVAAKTSLLRDRFTAATASTRRGAERSTNPTAKLALEAAKPTSTPVANTSPTTDAPTPPTDPEPRPRAITDGQFIDSPLGAYLAAVTFMKTNEPEQQSVAARRLRSAIDAQGLLIGDVDPANFSGLAQLSPSNASVLLVALSGRGPVKFAQRVGPIPLFDFPVYFELPQLRTFPSQARSVRATLTPESGDSPPREVTLNLIEDMGRVASENHRRQLPLIYTRTLVRAAVKSAATAVAAGAVRRGQGGSRGRSEGEAILVVLGGLAAMVATERADIRCWTFLPGRAHVALVELPPGRYNVRFDYLGPAGPSAAQTVLFTEQQPPLTVTGDPRDLATSIAHWWR